MESFTIPAPAWGLFGAGLAAAVSLWQARRGEKSEQRKSSGTVETSDAKTIFDSAMTNFEQSEKLRHDLRDQVDRCQTEIGKLKDENRALINQLNEQAAANADRLTKYRERVEALEDELFDMSVRLGRHSDVADRLAELPTNPISEMESNDDPER